MTIERRTDLLCAALGEAAEFRLVAEAVVEWGEEAPSPLCGACWFPRWNHHEGCPVPLAQAALAAMPKVTESPGK